MKRIIALLSLAVLFPLSAASEVDAAGRLRIGAHLKYVYTHRERDERTGVAPVSQAGLSWAGLSFAGEVPAAGSGRVSYLIELAANSGIYADPLGPYPPPAATSNPGELGRVGVRQGSISYFKSREAGFIDELSFEVKVGTFIPRLGLVQARTPAEWRFVDLPLTVTDPAFNSVGWQSAGLEVVLAGESDGAESEKITAGVNAFLINGYMPSGRVNQDQIDENEGVATDKGIGVRFFAGYGPATVFGAYYEEKWAQDLTGGPAPEDYVLRAYKTGGSIDTPRFWIEGEYTGLMVDDYQLMLDGTMDLLETRGFYAAGGINFGDYYTARLRYDWIDPNAENSDDTFALSNHDQLERWTVGLTAELSPAASLLVDYVMPDEQGDEVDYYKGLVGGKHRRVENDYLRVQVQAGI